MPTLKIKYAFLLCYFLAPADTFGLHTHASTHRKHLIGRALQQREIYTYHPKPTFRTFGQGFERPIVSQAFVDDDNDGDSLKAYARASVAAQLSVETSEISYTSGYHGETAEYAYVRQIHNDVPFVNAVANVAFRGSKVMSFGSSFVNISTSKMPSSTPSIDKDRAIRLAEDNMHGTYTDWPTSLQYLVRSDSSVALVHAVQVRNHAERTAYEVYIDAHDGEVVGVVDFVAQASYRVTPVDEIAPQGALEVIVDPQDLKASPQGWHNDGNGSTSDTSGNNLIAIKIDVVTGAGSTTFQSSENLTFDYVFDPTQEPFVPVNLNAARTHLFYILNVIHDVAYQYGFTEKAFNFQNNNFEKGGLAGDRVIASAQDDRGFNNAFMVTLPDGQPGSECAMFLFDSTKPYRDGSMVNDIPTHEYTHGITNRMTGGGTGKCLQATEAAGLGEGWSDTMANWIQAKATFQDFITGAYVLNNTGGVRTYPYSTNTTTNPLKYSDVEKAEQGVHEIGEVWANMLHNVLASLIKAHGFSGVARTNPGGTQGNVVFLHLMIDALAIQPCNPTFVNARDAFIQADVNRYGGDNRCTIWRVFASRGLGVKAQDYVDDFTLPSDCT